MDWAPASLSRFEASTITFVADVRLSLGPSGLFWVLGLARIVPVWLVQTHWAIIEDSFYLREEALVRWLAREPEESTASCRTAVADACETWRNAGRQWQLESCPNLYWPAERQSEAVLPKDGRRGLWDLCEALAAGLDRRLSRSPESVNARADCARDALALAAALSGTRPVLLTTTLARGESEPALARSLDEADIPCARISASRWARCFDRVLAPVLMHAGLTTGLATGCLRLAGVQIAAPRAVAPAAADEAKSEGEQLAWNAAEHGDEARLWDGAAAVCWEVKCEA